MSVIGILHHPFMNKNSQSDRTKDYPTSKFASQTSIDSGRDTFATMSTTHHSNGSGGKPRQVRAFPTVPSHVEECDSEQKYSSTGSSVGGGYSGGEYRYHVSNLQKHPSSPPVRETDNSKQYNARTYQDTSNNNNNRSDILSRKLETEIKSALPDRTGSPASASSGSTHPGPLDFTIGTIGGSKNSSLHDLLDCPDTESTYKYANADNLKAAAHRNESCQARAAQKGKPEPINSDRLRAIRQKTRNVVVSINFNYHFFQL